MERNYDKVISEMLIQLANIEMSLEKENSRMEAFDKRMELTIKRMVKAEARLEASESRMEVFDQKLNKSIEDQKEFSHMQSKMNKFFLDYIEKRNGKTG